LTVIDGVTRLLPGVIKKESLQEESFSNGTKKGEYPQYTRPEKFYPETKTRKTLGCSRSSPDRRPQKIKEWRQGQ